MPRRGSILTRCIPILQKSRVMFGLAFAQMVLRRTRLIDVYLEPLIEELLQLWHVGVRAYDHSTDNEFTMQAALMWTVNDLPAYGIASGWSTAGVMGCLVCMDDTRAFHLQHEGYGTDHKWTKKSIFWDLPYWSMLLIQHNLDVMHIEKNIFDNIFNTVMDIKGKTKDNLNARRDLKSICNCPELELDERRPNVMHKAAYTLSKEQKRRVCQWINGLQFPDGYASILARCVDMTELRMHGMKSYDCHVFMQNLIPIVFLEMLPEHVHELENNVSIILCNLEKIFPPAFFDSIEHLIVHLPNEARIGGPVQYRWTYQFERFLRELKKKVPIFNYPGRASGAPKKRWLTGPERHIIQTYILTNCEVVTPYYDITIRETQLLIDWIQGLVQSACASHADQHRKRATEITFWGPSGAVTSVPCYFVKDYNFQTERHNTGKTTMSCDCRWVDPVRGMKVHPRYHLIDVNFKKLYKKDEPFILAQQAVQVYFTQYLSLKRDKADWLAVAEVKARRVVDESKCTEICTYQPDEVLPVPVVGTDNQTYGLRDPNGYKLWSTIRAQVLHEVRRTKRTMIMKTLMKTASRTMRVTMMSTD
ncbi:UNVERIFIED_CONTAM: hypothetical protein Slati_2194900 [Sesamum latifolium]|uniref:DUF4218 domain-containing protein n=1 Tax=Sesamum latifolium TaxID=2727402 RepID=A0AAW2WW48_9LAMI